MLDETIWPLNLVAMARVLRVPATWLREEAEAGRIPHLKAGRSLLFDPAAVEVGLRKRLEKAAQEPRHD